MRNPLAPLLLFLMAPATIAQAPIARTAPRAAWIGLPGVTGTPTQRRDNREQANGWCHGSAPGARRRGGRRRYPWAELLRRVWLVDVLVCPHCRGVRRLLGAIHDPVSIDRVLVAMGLPTLAPEMAAARSPPTQAALPG